MAAAECKSRLWSAATHILPLRSMQRHSGHAHRLRRSRTPRSGSSTPLPPASRSPAQKIRRGVECVTQHRRQQQPVASTRGVRGLTIVFLVTPQLGRRIIMIQKGVTQKVEAVKACSGSVSICSDSGRVRARESTTHSHTYTSSCQAQVLAGAHL